MLPPLWAWRSSRCEEEVGAGVGTAAARTTAVQVRRREGAAGPAGPPCPSKGFLPPAFTSLFLQCDLPQSGFHSFAFKYKGGFPLVNI